mmetsp:Transcript_39782/g.80182  ORF Transcript_39782/g.80182 Transcript_39782/m.80182 type:complete len:214 (-) Transcript_39782:319-960(-)|eukprot:CAMPEP_0202821390 /NCGR_PEP_ID=MMETSP1389-20130828/10343_1 /ASSEMBLY_ACC=CAM_ASM_000865 /TAXON_ID=302021 /ORGANISM="Rhodomonas sp., Strain CCMP768" /LENGTH=213 /DNA_ID=CAMNT_0049494149 /DNA_START=209 /DNA_END=850 /DNA_ORIENTATION=-
MNSKPIPAIIPAIISSSTHQTKNVKLEKQLSPPPMGPIPCVAPATTDLANEVHQDSAPCTSTAKRPTATKRWDQQSGDDIVTLFPRRKAGQNRPGGGKGPVVLTLELLEQFYGMPLHVAAKRLGICQTAIKKVCRRLGIKKWPYKEMRQPSGKDDGAASPPASPEEASYVLSIDGVQQSSPPAVAGGKAAGGKAGDDVDFAVRALLDLQGIPA